MKKCKCGSTEFVGSVMEPILYTVDESGCLAECIGPEENYDLSCSEAVYSCAECGEVYETWDEIPEA
jgi:hypothetical protein